MAHTKQTPGKAVGGRIRRRYLAARNKPQRRLPTPPTDSHEDAPCLHMEGATIKYTELLGT
jgi:hypothetical protein